ncbi:uncharacterized protein PHALS_11095 [Plasmopara halstedii]|uniref:Uncharacterized protein n=1 Tax=Plasmopara halstedii TaxID=4781 RepID=A0A0P1AIN9_PLAHL|nr:uncharacterized protein PHALS_11095 [Plasmopara halstedii]CEG40919.1 hypothetical protein PHALS_11095 [Plasmopara halstedii]|eukprot:XP_024577288.1 hypothetical protein PHALS_11095 [Plasmopara halstedii]
MATPTEREELKRGNGAWENIQEVLRFGLRSLWEAITGVDGRVTALEKTLVAQRNDLQRQQQHLEDIAHTLNVMGERLRVYEKAAGEQIAMRLQNSECRLQGQFQRYRNPKDDVDYVPLTTLERRVCLLEEEIEHIVVAIDRKADFEVMEEAIRKHCKKDEREILTLQKRFEQHRHEVEKEVSLSISNAQAAQETLIHSALKNWAANTWKFEHNTVQEMLAEENLKQKEVLSTIHSQIKLCWGALEAQQKRMTDVCVDINKQVHDILAADRKEIAVLCSEAHGRIDFQFRAQEKGLEKVQHEQHKLREDVTQIFDMRIRQIATGNAAAVEALNRRVFDRQLQELSTMRCQIVEEVQLTVASTLNALKSTKDREQRKVRHHQNLIERKLAELEQMMQLIGRQSIRNIPQLQVVRNEQLEHAVTTHIHNEDEDNEDAFLFEDKNGAEHTIPILAQVPSSNLLTTNDSRQNITELLTTRRVQHRELQKQLDIKFSDYSEILRLPEQRAKENKSSNVPSTQP